MDLVFYGACYLKEILILNSFSFEDKNPSIHKAKTSLALRLLSYLSKGLLYKGSGVYDGFIDQIILKL